MFHKTMVRGLMAAAVATTTLSAVGMAQVVINFDGIPDQTPVTTQYAGQGVTFSSAVILRSDGSLNSTLPPHSGNGVVYDYPTGTIRQLP